MTKRDDGGKDGGHSGKLTLTERTAMRMTSSGTRVRFYGGGNPTRNHAPKANALGLTPDKDGAVQVQLDFGQESAELTAEEAAALDFLQKDAEADNTEQLPEPADLTAEEAAALDLLEKKGAEAEETKRYLRLIRLIKFHRTSETDASMRIARAPGSLLANISEFVFSRKTLERVINPIIADMQTEYCEALSAKRPYKAKWVRVRYCWSFAKAVGLYSLLKAVVEMWRKVS